MDRQNYLIMKMTIGRFWKLTEGTLKIGRKMLPPEGSHVCARQLCYYTHNIPFMQCGVFLYCQTLIINGHLHNKIVLSVHFVITCIVETSWGKTLRDTNGKGECHI
jgi:hypothetical protein